MQVYVFESRLFNHDYEDSDEGLQSIDGTIATVADSLEEAKENIRKEFEIFATHEYKYCSNKEELYQKTKCYLEKDLENAPTINKVIFTGELRSPDMWF